ncbi:MAG: PKD domain-containing protein [Flavihumibacter sp.]|nr:PKD domain-containing protein [Flavihumibacter sp.]
MIKNINLIATILITVLFALISCKKEEFKFGEIKTPTNLNLTAVVQGVDANNPNGNGTGNVTITTTSVNALSYNIDFGDGITQVVPSGTVTHKYSNPGTSSYTISVNAIGTGGAISTISKKITVFVAFEIPADILQAFTNGASKIWVTDNAAQGHFGVGQNDLFFPNYYSAGPNTREACAYDDEITFTKDPLNRISMSINNKGQSFSIGAATAFYGMAGGDGCYGINAGNTKQLAFMEATSASTTANSTRVQFTVPGNGIINFGTGGTTYEILSVTNNSIHLRNIGTDGNAWYQKLKPKP